MGQAPIDAVLAGTKGFAVALLAPLTAKVGTRPRVAGDPGQVLALCSGPSALAVIEFTGEGSLNAVQALVRDGRGVRVVAGLPPAHAGAEGTLRALGVEVGQWDGKVDGVIAAVQRAVTAMSGSVAPTGARPAPRPPPAVAPAPAGPGAVTPVPVATAVRPAAAPAAPVAARAAAPARPHPPGPPVAPRPAAAPPVARPPPTQPRAVAAAPPAAKPALRPASPPRVAPAAAPAASPGTFAPPPAPAAAPAAPRRPATAEVVARPPPALAPAAPAPRPAPASQFFDDLDTVTIDDDTPATHPGVAVASAAELHVPGMYAPPPAEPRADWPAGICSAAEAEDALQRALGGAVGGSRPLQDLALRTLDALSDLERGVLSGEPQPIDAAPIRRAAVMRLRVADGLASVPPAGSPVDSAALSAILGEIDALLAEVAPLMAAAPEELAPALEAIRNSLVSEAIDFSEAAQRVAPAGAPPPQAAVPLVRRKNEPRILSIQSAQEAELEAAEGHRRQVAWIVMAIALALALLYHGWGYLSRPKFVPPPTVAGAPTGSMAGDALRSGRQLVYSPTGKFDPAEVEKFRTDQELKGNKVEEIAPGVLRITPAGAGGK